MKPNDNKNLKKMPTSKNDGYLDDPATAQRAAANIIRAQIEGIYAKQQTINEKATINKQKTEIPNHEYLKKYHSAWQNYYQKYYEGYYTVHVKKQIEKINAKNKQESNEEQKISDIKKQILSRVKSKGKKFRKSNHFLPIVAGLISITLFLFIQYNQILSAKLISYLSPGSIDPQNIVIDPSTDVIVTPDSRLIIPKINVDAPVIYDIANDYVSQMDAMGKGIAHFAIPGASSHPGELGNTILSGHSSNDLFDTGQYKFIFAQLEKLKIGDTIYTHYNSKRYTYSITNIETVNPTDVNKLSTDNSKPILTLITCTPLGTSKFRLLVTATQISPNPSKAVSSNTNQSAKEPTVIPGETKSLFQRLFN